ncbi:hypothetical protein V5O48_003088 [Marasmius crinis-equi]|uniref:Helitron helicase-like domain-containing protein n=1 Tax=Marasmius crinis-equi TaxID=585013 RepID=A0ABR3FTS8_9AGAR
MTIRPAKVRTALEWLKTNNPLFRHIVINYELLQSLYSPSQSMDSLLDSYDPLRKLPIEEQELDDKEEPTQTPRHENSPKRITEKDFEKVDITNVASNATPNDLRTAALNHIKYRRGGYLEIRHEKGFVREFMIKNPSLFPMMYPTLFPYGLGGLDDPIEKLGSQSGRTSNTCATSETREHASFLFSSFSMLQRHEMLINTVMKIRNKMYRNMARDFTEVSPSAVAAVSSRIAEGDTVTWRNQSEKKVLHLMKHARIMTGKVQGSAEAKKHQRNEIRALSMVQGSPAYYITINPALQVARKTLIASAKGIWYTAMGHMEPIQATRR